MSDLSGAEDAPAAAHDVVTGHARRLVDDDKASFGHRTIAVSARPSRTDQRPDSVSKRRPGHRGRIDQDPRFEPARRAAVVDVEGDVRVLESQPAPRQRKPRLVRRLLGAEQDSIPMQTGGQRLQFDTFDGQADRVEHTLGQHVMRFGVDADRAHRVVPADRGAAKALAVREAADDAVGPARFALLPLEDRHRRHAQLAQRLPCAVPHGDELVAPLGHRLRDQRLLLRQRQPVPVGPCTSRRQQVRSPSRAARRTAGSRRSS